MSSAAHILEQVDCTFGRHNLIIFGDLETLREFYSSYCKRALDDNEVVVMLSYYEPVKRVYTYLENAGTDVELHKRAHSLFVEDSIEQFYGTGSDFYGFLRLLDEGVIRQQKKGVCVLVSADAFHLYGETKDLMEYETKIEATHDFKNTSIICMYHAESFASLSKKDQEGILGKHNKVVK